MSGSPPGVMQGPRLYAAVSIPSQGHIFAFSQGGRQENMEEVCPVLQIPDLLSYRWQEQVMESHLDVERLGANISDGESRVW